MAINITGQLNCTASDRRLAVAAQIWDESIAKTQQVINSELKADLETISEIRDDDGIIKSEYLPGFVDDVLEYAGEVSGVTIITGSAAESAFTPTVVFNTTTSKFVQKVGTSYYAYWGDAFMYGDNTSSGTTPSKGKIYVNTTNNLTYRWSGTQLVEISKSLALGETSSTAYAGDKGKTVTDKVANIISKTSSILSSVHEIELGGNTVNISFSAKKFDSNGDVIDAAQDVVEAIIPSATTTKAGVMSATDKTKLDNITIITEDELKAILV